MSLSKYANELSDYQQKYWELKETYQEELWALKTELFEANKKNGLLIFNNAKKREKLRKIMAMVLKENADLIRENRRLAAALVGTPSPPSSAAVPIAMRVRKTYAAANTASELRAMQARLDETTKAYRRAIEERDTAITATEILRLQLEAKELAKARGRRGRARGRRGRG